MFENIHQGRNDKDMISLVCLSPGCANSSEGDKTGKDTWGQSLRMLVQDVFECLSTNNSLTIALSGCYDKVLGFY